MTVHGCVVADIRDSQGHVSLDGGTSQILMAGERIVFGEPVVRPPANLVELDPRRVARTGVRTALATSAARSGVLAGPWVEAFWFEVPFPVRSKSNYRHSRRPESRAAWEAEKAFQDSLAAIASGAVPASWDLGGPDADLCSRPTVVAVIGARTLLDAGNLSKSVLDALEDVVYVNDAVVRSCLSVAVRASKGACGVVAFARLAPAAKVPEMVAATSALAGRLGSLTELDG